jgi:hypothetical protein
MLGLLLYAVRRAQLVVANSSRLVRTRRVTPRKKGCEARDKQNNDGAGTDDHDSLWVYRKACDPVRRIPRAAPRLGDTYGRLRKVQTGDTSCPDPDIRAATAEHRVPPEASGGRSSFELGLCQRTERA